MAALSAAPPSSAVADEFARLVEALGTIPDFRKRNGRRRPLSGVLGLVVLGLMANCRLLSAISRYAQIHPEILPPLGLTRPPSVPTLSRVAAGIEPAQVRGIQTDLMARLARRVLTFLVQRVRTGYHAE